MKNFFKKLWDIMNDPRYEKSFIIALPCIALLIAALILAPQVKASMARQAGEELVNLPQETAGVSDVVLTPASTASPTATEAPAATKTPETSPAVTATPSPTETPKATAAPTQAVSTALSASSTERDLYITVCNAKGNAISGQQFKLTITYPDGEKFSFKTELDGSCYIVDLSPGEYSVSMSAQNGYAKAETIKCTVKDKVEYVPIENIEAIVEIKDVGEIPTEEVEPDTGSGSSGVVEAEIITTPAEYSGEGIVVKEEYPKLDANGNQVYTYTYNVGPNGYLLYKNSSQESDVMPVDEDNDGVLDYGLRFVVPTTPEQGSESELTANGYYESVILFNSDNTPVSSYDITATPVVSYVSTRVGWQRINGEMYYYLDGEPVTGLKKIDGKIYYFDNSGVRASSVGIDVSFYNDDINWQAVKAQGIDFAIIRLGGRTWRDGDLYGDSMTQEYLKEAKNAGLKIGAYFYSTAISPVEAVQEASVALNILNVNGVELDLPLFIDMEYSGIYPAGRSDNLSASQRTEIIRAFCETVENGGYTAGVYSGEYFYKTALNYKEINQYTVWLASYTSNNALPGFTGRYDIWQFTDSGRLNGIDGYVDMNVIF